MKQRKRNKKKTELRKKAMLEALKSSLGNVTAAAEKIGIDRTTHYYWLREDPEYNKQYEQLPELQLDFYEQALNKLVKGGNVTAVIFALKCKGKNRGWFEKKQISQTMKLSGNLGINKLTELARQKYDQEEEKDQEKSD